MKLGIVLFLSFFGVLFTSGPLFGWSSMLLVYQEEGVYSNLCNTTNGTIVGNSTKTVCQCDFSLTEIVHRIWAASKFSLYPRVGGYNSDFLASGCLSGLQRPSSCGFCWWGCYDGGLPSSWSGEFTEYKICSRSVLTMKHLILIFWDTYSFPLLVYWFTWVSFH